jgi:hypothetical protein
MKNAASRANSPCSLTHTLTHSLTHSHTRTLPVLQSIFQSAICLGKANVRPVCNRTNGGAALTAQPVSGLYSNRPYLYQGNVPSLNFKLLMEGPQTRRQRRGLR